MPLLFFEDDMNLKDLLIEYLTDEQRRTYSNFKMTDEARKATDHYFGEGNDVMLGHVDDSAGHHHEKSEIHRAVERHLGKEISTEEYRAGKGTDHLGRQTRLGRLIKDAKLRDQFASDTTREGAKIGSIFTTSTHRGVEVAGQTNSESDAKHPNGHSWGGQSCKNVVDGSNKHFLKDEIRHGTVVHFVHDHDGKEIYRATLHPHHNDDGHTLYAVDSEYGVKHPAFTASAHKAAQELTHPDADTVSTYTKHPKVYDDNGVEHAFHHDAPSWIIDHQINKDIVSYNERKRYHRISPETIKSLTNHPKINDSHFEKILFTHNAETGKQELDHKALGAFGSYGIEHRIPSHIADKIVHHPSDDDRAVGADLNVTAVKKLKLSPAKHVELAQHDNPYVARAALNNTHATADVVRASYHGLHKGFGETAIRHPNAPQDVLDHAKVHGEGTIKTTARITDFYRKPVADQHKVLETDSDIHNLHNIVSHPRAMGRASSEHIESLYKNPDPQAKLIAVTHPYVPQTVLRHAALNHAEAPVRAHAISQLNVNNKSKDVVAKAMDDEHPGVRIAAINFAAAPRSTLEKGLQDPHDGVRSAAQKRLANYR
jgi:hypothetical protein